MPFSSLRPRNSEAQRCGHLWSIIPTLPDVSRNAISCSPKSIRRIGAASRSNSDDIAAGIQYCRIILPMTVPGPTRTRSSLSLRFMAPSLSRADRHSQPMGLLRPEGKAEPGAGAGRRAIAGLVERPFEREMLNRAGEADPVADLGAAGVELVAWQRLDSGGIVPLEHVDKAPVERLVHDKMRQPARPDDADPLVF